jgi:hypothetical protein
MFFGARQIPQHHDISTWPMRTDFLSTFTPIVVRYFPSNRLDESADHAGLTHARGEQRFL